MFGKFALVTRDHWIQGNFREITFGYKGWTVFPLTYCLRLFLGSRQTFINGETVLGYKQTKNNHSLVLLKQIAK